MTLEEIISFGLGASDIDIESNMDNTPEWDSLNHILLCDYLMTAFEIKLSFDEMIEIISVSKIRDLLDRKGIYYES